MMMLITGRACTAIAFVFRKACSRACRCSSLRQPGLAHAVADVLTVSQIGRIVARRAGAEAGDGESGIEGKPGLNRGPRLIEPAKMRQRGGEIEMRERKISVHLDGATQPRDRLLVSAKQQFGEAGVHHPAIGARIARTEAKRLLDMALGFLAATHIILGETDSSVSHC